MKRSLAALVAMALIAAACGGDGDADTTVTTAVVETTEAPTTTAADADMDDDMMDEDIVAVAAGAGSFTTLLTAAEAAGLVGTLQGEGPFTVFAPTDAAFAALPAGTLDDLLANPDALSQVLLYHVVPGKVLAADVVGLDSATSVEGSDITITVNDGTVMVDDATVVTTDIAASNGVIHVIDAVILPDSLEAMGDDEMSDDTIVGVAAGAGTFDTLLAAAEAAGLVETLQSEGPFTVFAPTDEAFAALPDGTLDGLLADVEALREVLLYHVVPGAVRAADVVGLASATSAQGSDIAITVTDGAVMVDDANVIATDVEASNGIIHVIDAVILPS